MRGATGRATERFLRTSMGIRVGLGLALGLVTGLGWAGAHAASREAPALVGRVVALDAEDAVPAGPSLELRLDEIRRRIQAAAAYPRLARERRLSGVARVEFEIDRGGFATGVRVSRSSGYGLLDRAAEASVTQARPLPWVYGRLEVPVRFELHETR